MKKMKLLSGLFAMLGTLLMAGTAALCLTSLDAQPRLLDVPGAAREQAAALMEAVGEGDYAAAGSCLQGQPDLGAAREPADEVGAVIWEAFLDSLSYEFVGELYAAENGLAWDVRIDALNISAVTDSMEGHFQTLLEQRVAEAENMSDIYDESYNYREDLVTELLCQAAELAAADAETVSREVTLKLVCQDGQWWVSPEGELLQAISGGIIG